MKSPNNSNFGVGCFHFGYEPKEAIFTGKDYLSDLNKALSNISNIEDIQIDVFDDFNSRSFNSAETVGELENNFNFFPFPGSGIEITFTLFIPSRIQNDLKIYHQFLDTSCERFIVRTKYTYFFPITIIKAITDDLDYEGSESVIICREFLRECFKNNQSSKVIFECLGPSPFHADFILELSEEIKEYEFQRIAAHGYDRLIFQYNKNLFENIDTAFERLFEDLDPQLGVFYKTVHISNFRDDHWMSFYRELQSTLESQSKKSAKAYLKNTFKSERILNDLMLQVSEIEIYDLDIRYQLEKCIKDIYLGDKPPELLDYIKNELLNLTKLPFEQVKESLRILESRRSKRINSYLMIFTAIIGGAVGALLTMALKNGG